MKTTASLAVLLLLAGCTTVVDPGLAEDCRADADWKGVTCVVEAAGDAPSRESKPGAMTTYVLETKTWNEFLAKCLREEVEKRGATMPGTPALKVALAGIVLEDRAINNTSRAEMEVRVSCLDWFKTYKGLYESELNFHDAIRKAAADAVRLAVEDPELRKAAGQK